MNEFLLDMDGVLFDWDAAFNELYGDPQRMSPDELDRCKREMSQTNFYLNLKPIEEGFKLFHKLSSIGKCRILTSAGKYNTEEVVRQKKESLVRELGYLPEFYSTKSSVEKSAFVDKGVLFDDRVKAVMPFRAAGGRAVLFVGSAEQAMTDLFNK